MKISDNRIDKGKLFDWGMTSKDYSKYRDIYPDIFYQKILEKNLCIAGQSVLDIGTGTGVIPRNMYKYGAKWTGTDIAENQIVEARRMSEENNMNIDYIVSPTEELNFPDNSYDVITACQCFWYFKHDIVAPKLFNFLKDDGHLLILYMAWLPYIDKIAGESEKLVLKYNPQWSGGGETKHPIHIPDEVLKHFDIVSHEEFDVAIPFTKETWNGRMKACRGIGASLSDEEISSWENEHLKMLSEIAGEKFEIKHYIAMVDLCKKKIR